MTSKTVVIPAGVDEIVEDAILDCGRVDKLHLKEGAAINRNTHTAADVRLMQYDV